MTSRTMKSMHRTLRLGRNPQALQAVPVAAFFFALSLASATLGLGMLSGAPSDVARAAFLVFLLSAFVPLLRAANHRG